MNTFTAKRGASATEAVLTDLLTSGWNVTGSDVHVVYTTRLAHAASFLIVSVQSQDGQTRVLFESASDNGEHPRRRFWHAQATLMPAELIAAVAQADESTDHTADADVGDMLTAAGWRHLAQGYWASPDGQRRVSYLTDSEPDDGLALRWWIRCFPEDIEIHASDGTPPAVIRAFALTDAPAT